MAVPSSAITRTDLSATFHEFELEASRKKFIGPQVMRPVMVGVQAADVGKVPLEALLQTHDDSRAPGAGYKRSDFEFAKYSYATDEHGFEEPMDDRTLKIYRSILDAEAIHSQRAIDQVLRNFEIAAAAAIYNTTTWTGAALTTAITEEWDTHAAAVPITDVEAARQKVIDGCGLVPNALIANRKQIWNCCQTAQIVDRLKYWGGDDPKNISAATLAAILDLDYILVAGGFKNTANQGQSASISTIWSDENMMLAKVAVTDDPQEECVARCFMWNEENAGAGTDEELAVIVEEYREEGVRGSVVRARNDRDIVVMYAEAAHLLSNAITI